MVRRSIRTHIRLADQHEENLRPCSSCLDRGRPDGMLGRSQAGSGPIGARPGIPPEEVRTPCLSLTFRNKHGSPFRWGQRHHDRWLLLSPLLAATAPHQVRAQPGREGLCVQSSQGQEGGRDHGRALPSRPCDGFGAFRAEDGRNGYGSASILNIARAQKSPESQLHLLRAGQPLVIGQANVTAYETPRSQEPINVGSIDHPLHVPAKLGEYKLGENYSFLVEHRLGNVLIVPSANYKPNAFDGIHAPVSVLGIGVLG